MNGCPTVIVCVGDKALFIAKLYYGTPIKKYLFICLLFIQLFCQVATSQLQSLLGLHVKNLTWTGVLRCAYQDAFRKILGTQ